MAFGNFSQDDLKQTIAKCIDQTDLTGAKEAGEVIKYHPLTL